jgi:hypothetical protein
MAQPNFLPDVWTKKLADTWAQQSAYIESMFGPVRKGHHLPLTESQLRQFEDFKLRYNAIVAEGEAKGYLDYDRDGGAFFTTPYGERVWDETEEEFAARHAEWVANGPTVTFPAATDD